ncbi:MAG TPA: PQQ-binding-like beta-propeller repeat protein [Gemmataceae bacterium]|nr:PQQ-binding-like beta-propeller repeat protein [Gemmataceae bacterium]
MRTPRWRTPVFLLVGFLSAANAAHAVIQRLTPLKDVLAESQFIFVAKVDVIDPDKPSVVLKVDEQLKGKATFEKLPINLTGDSEAKKLDHTPQLLKRLAPKLTVIVFASKQDKKYTAFAFSNGTWFQLVGEEADRTVRWSFTHCEPYLRRTFKGSTADLKEIIEDGLAGKKKPPEPDAKEKPGLGPEASSEGKDQSRMENGEWRMENGILLASQHRIDFHSPFSILHSPFPPAVIPSVALGSAVAVLAALFPAVFGGLMIVMRRWMMLLSVASVNSTLYFLYSWFGGSFYDKWWGDSFALWLLMTAITMLGTLWAWKRNLAAVQAGEAVAGRPNRTEWLVLWATSLAGLLTLGLFLWRPYWLPSPMAWKLLLVFVIGIWAGLIYLLLGKMAGGKGQLPSEGIALWAMVFAATGFAATWPRSGLTSSFESGNTYESAAHYVGEVWKFVPEGNGTIASTPLADGDRLFVATAQSSGVFGKAFGKLYCLDSATGQKRWEFDDGGAMKQVFSSPCLANGRLYVGEGFHQDADCKLYCVDAATGQKNWDFPTKSHTESSPAVAAGKVFFGAGDDGVYCLDAITGKELWHFADNLHVDANPVIVGNRLYCGSGVGDAYTTLEVFCLDAETGKPIWRQPAELPVWGAPAVAGDQLFVGIGNGNFMTSDDKPQGALLCLKASTGELMWRYDLGDGIHVRPAFDKRHVYFAARDGSCYCLNRNGGELVWKRGLGSPIVASPFLAHCDCHTCSTSLFVAATGGVLVALEPATGQTQWTDEVFSKYNALILSSPTVELEVKKEDESERRRIYLAMGVNDNATPVLYCLEDRFEE